MSIKTGAKVKFFFHYNMITYVENSIIYTQRVARACQPTPVFLPGESQERGSLVGCRLWGCTELDTTEAT